MRLTKIQDSALRMFFRAAIVTAVDIFVAVKEQKPGEDRPQPCDEWVEGDADMLADAASEVADAFFGAGY